MRENVRTKGLKDRETREKAKLGLDIGNGNSRSVENLEIQSASPSTEASSSEIRQIGGYNGLTLVEALLVVISYVRHIVCSRAEKHEIKLCVVTAWKLQ